MKRVNKRPVDHFEGMWKKGKKYTLYATVINNGTKFRSLTAKDKDEPYVIYDSVNETFSANPGWEIVEMSEDSRLSAMGGNGGSKTPDISIGTVTTVEPGEPAAASMSGTPEAPVLNLSIPKGLVGATPNFTVGEVTTGQPGTPVVVTLTGTAEAPVLNLTIPQGMQGNTGSSVDYPYELVNNLTTNDSTKGLSAAQGVVLDGKVSQLEAKVTDLEDHLEDEITHSADEYNVALDKGTITADSWYQNNGTVGSHTGYSRTNKLPLNEGIYAIKVNFTTEDYRCHFFDENQTRINLVFHFENNVYYVIPSGAKYIGISGATASMTDLVITELVRGATHDAIAAKVNIAQGVINKGKLLYTDYGGNVEPHAFFSNAHADYAPNLFDKSRLQLNKDITGADKTNYATMTYYIPIYPGVKYCTNGGTIYQGWGYDEFGNVVSKSLGLSTTGTVLDSKIKFIRLCVYWGNLTATYFGIYAGLDSFGGENIAYGEIPSYYSVDPSFDEYLRRFGNLANQVPILAGDGGRYSGVDGIEQYSKLVHKSNKSISINDSAPSSDWRARGVNQYFKATKIDFTKDSGVNGIYEYPSDIGAVAGDTIYIGFLARSSDGLPHTSVIESDAIANWPNYDKRIFFDGNIRHYEFSRVVSEGEQNIKFSLSQLSNVYYEFSNLYVRKVSNAGYETLFIDPARYSAREAIVSENLATKNLLAFGDSVTHAGFYLESFTKRLPVADLDNEGIGGSCFTKGVSDNANFYQLVTTKETEIKAADIITVAYGTNDSNYIGHEGYSTIGEIAPVGSQFDCTTIFGAIQSGLETIIGFNPSARIVMIIPATWIVYQYRQDIAKAIADCAELYGCLLVDFRRCGCNSLTQTGMTWDGLHPTRDTGELCGKLLVDAFAPVYML